MPSNKAQTTKDERHRLAATNGVDWWLQRDGIDSKKKKSIGGIVDRRGELLSDGIDSKGRNRLAVASIVKENSRGTESIDGGVDRR
ncbi:hypothetical protein U1Q18_035556 [Sarracenia purpurea var. burkii]